LCARPVVGDEPFGVILPDDLIVNDGPSALRQMAEVASRENAGVIAVQEVPRDQTNKYGIVDVEEGANPRVSRIRHMVEKPAPEKAPSNLAVVGRYVLPGETFALLEQTTPGAGGEIQLTDALERLLGRQPTLAYRFAGRRFDCGNKRGLVQATLHMALSDPELAPTVHEFMAQTRASTPA